MRVEFRQILAGLVLFATACTQLGMPSMQVMKAAPDFATELARGYRALAEYETYIAGDTDSGAHFQAKAAAASSHVVPDHFVFEEDNKESKNVNEGRDVLMDARDTLNAGPNIRRIAEAQVNYDCWLERLVEKADTARWCRERFHSAIEEMELLQDHRYLIYFDKSKAIPDEQGRELIRQAAAAFSGRDLWRVRLTGYTDGAGNRDDNIILSMRRAVAVRNALAQQGVDPDQIVIAAVGEEGTVSERRVDITILPAYLDQSDAGPDITAIVPHYFSGRDF